jgi:hypothetical protein
LKAAAAIVRHTESNSGGCGAAGERAGRLRRRDWCDRSFHRFAWAPAPARSGYYR